MQKIQVRCINLRREISRIANTTLRGDFVHESDRQYWVDRLGKLNSELSALEEIKEESCKKK